MENQNINILLENQSQMDNDSLILKKVKFTKEQYKKLEIMLPFYYQDASKVEAFNLLIGDAVEYYFNEKFKKDITKE